MPRSKTAALFRYDRECAAAAGPGTVLVGLDEAGRGPLAGPVVAAAAILDPDIEIPGVNDSKRILAAKRPAVYDAIVVGALAWSVGMCSPEEIDRLNILQASLLAMQRALEKIPIRWSLALVDGNQLMPAVPAERQRAIVRGDGASACIAAASVIAKVTRDRMMAEYAAEFPVYGFDRHKGYPTAAHIAAIREHGVCRIHRRSFCENLVMQARLDL